MTSDPYNAFLHFEPQPGTGGPVVGVKDVIDVAGMPTTAASRILHRVPDQDADCVARLRAAGATIAGKLNTHEFAFGALTNSPHFGPALNPWNTAHTCGGSSGGSGAAVAAGLVDVSLGTDTAGSVRIPAAFCGVTGARPSAGLVSNAGVFPTAPTLDTVGPLARSAEECRDILETLAGRSLDEPERDLRIGVVTSLFEAADPGVAAACEAAMRELPGTLEPVAIPLHEEIATITQLIMLPEATATHLPWLRTRLADYGADVRARLLAGLFLPPHAHATGLRGRALGARRVGARPRRLRRARRACDADHRAASRRDPAGLPAAGHALQLAGRPARPARRRRPLRLRRRAPRRARAHRPPRRGRRPAGACPRVPGGDRLAPPEPD